MNLLDDELFVGRERELVLFQEWLTSEPRVPELLNVCGRGGIGKSTLLRAFARLARASGQTVALVDSSDFPHIPEGFLQALAPGKADPVEYINRTQPLLLLDSYERLGELHRYIQREFLPKLSTQVKVVIAGRHPLEQGWVEVGPWRLIIRSIPLERFTEKECEEYLQRRKVQDQRLKDNLLKVSSGNPLVLSLMADMALQLGFRDFQIAPEWHLVLRSLTEQLLRDVDAELRELLEAAAVVRQFDEMALAAVSGQEQVGKNFDLLCKLSVVRPAEHGLILHDDVRWVLCEDLRWRRPDRYKQLRLRALAYYQKRMRSAPSLERERLLAESYFLWENAYAKGLLFDDDELGQVWLEAGQPEDAPEIISNWVWWKNNVMLKAIESTTDVACDVEIMEKLLRYPGTRLRVARDRDRHIMGFNMALPLCRESLALVEGHPVLEPALNAYCQQVDGKCRPMVKAATAGFSPIWPTTTACPTRRELRC
ncbi:MAG: hypothetical protein ACOX87_12515 [Chloroflexota bacterium]